MAMDAMELIYPYEPEFWRHPEVQELDLRLSYLGPLPQTNQFTEQVVGKFKEPAYVYVIQDDEGDVLYVGKTINPVARLANHRRQKEWWPDDGLLTLLGVWGFDRSDADRVSFRLEAIAIRDLEPRYNIAGVRNALV